MPQTQTYDPFRRGPHPVGVRTLELGAGDREKPLVVELWYPATDAHRGQDLAAESRDSFVLFPGFPIGWQWAVRDAEPRDGHFPLVLFSHGFGAHRCQSTFLTTHLASHGYLVAACDHRGNTATVLIEKSLGAGGSMRREFLRETMADRPGAIHTLLDGLLAEPLVAARIADTSSVGGVGHSLGGWTMMMAAADPRIASLALLAPAIGESPFRDDLGMTRGLATLVVAGAEDSLLPLAGIRTTYGELTGPKRLVVIDRADHMHFCDSARRLHEMVRRMPMIAAMFHPHQELAPFDELCPARAAQKVIRGLVTAHFDVVFAEEVQAAALLEGDLVAVAAADGVSLRVE